MGNCLTCFKEPPPSALDNTNHCHKEDMPEALLYSTPIHAPTSTSTALTETALLSNGNHLSSAPLTLDNLLPSNNRFYSSKKSHAKSAPAMGASDSRLSDNKLNAFFEQYKDDSEDAMLAEGIEQFCKDLQVSPDDFKILLLAWKLNADQMCRFTRDEFIKGLKKLRVDSIKGIQSKLPELVNEVIQNQDRFKDLYRYTFHFGLDSAAGQRILPTHMAIPLWRLVFTARKPPILDRWLAFLESHQCVRGISCDTWCMFLNFSEAVGDDLSSYDDNEAWPSLFDDFVEYENDQANQNVTKECQGLIGRGEE